MQSNFLWDQRKILLFAGDTPLLLNEIDKIKYRGFKYYYLKTGFDLS